ncbi:MAG: hypothetical protein GKS06_18765 [Acidobacteria bacterium]|nr:hypothetical protein [Acidobacteriota bacterium]
MSTTRNRYPLGWAGRADGKAKIGSLISLLVVVAAVYIGMKFIPVRAAAYQFDDTVREQVVFAGARRRQIGNEEIMRNLMGKADELGLPITRGNVRITRRTNRIRIQAAWKTPIELPFDFTYEWTFVADHEGPSF